MKKRKYKNIYSNSEKRVANRTKVGNPRPTLFETIKILNKKLQNMEFHNKRFNRSRLDVFGIDEKLKLEEVVEIPLYIDKGIYKCRIIYSEKIEKIEFETAFPRVVKSLKLIECNDIEYGYKYYDRSKINELYAQREKYDDVLIVKNGFITDTSQANVVFWDGQNWITSSTPLLPGTNRQKLIEEKKIMAREIKVEDLKLYKKARVINALVDLEDSDDIVIFSTQA